MSPDPQAEMKRAAAEAAAALVGDGMVVGLGTGSTATFAIEALIRRVREGLRIEAIPTSERSAAQARAGGIPLSDFARHQRIDLTIDGADEVERGSLNLIKGLGGALLREKIVAAASARLVIVADASKLVDRLGACCPVPVEVADFGWQATAAQLAALGARVSRRESAPGTVFLTDGGNPILDCGFGTIADPAALDIAIRRIVGVIETGLFIARAGLAIIAGPEGLTRLSPD